MAGRSFGSLALALWFLLYGIFHFAAAPSEGLILAVLALVTSILLLAGR